MKVTETLREGLRRECRVVVSAEEIDKEVMDKLRDAQPEFEIQGFRRGKVPLPMLRKRYGGEVAVQAMQEKVQIALAEHLEEVKERPAFRPEANMTKQGWQPGQDVEVVMSYEVLPEIPDIDCRAIELEKLVVDLTEAEVDEEARNFASQYPEFKDRAMDAPAEKGDQVVIDLAQSIAGVPIEGGEFKDVALFVDEDDISPLHPDFSKQFVGVRVSEEKTFSLTFPADHPVAPIAGKTLEFACSIKAVQVPIESQVDEAFAKRLGYEDLAALKTNVREQVARDCELGSWLVLKRSLFDKLDENASFDVPPTMVQIESVAIQQQIQREENPDMEGARTSAEPTDEHRRLAERRVRLGLLMAEIGREAEIALTDSEFSYAVNSQARQYPGQEREFIKAVNDNPEMRRRIEAPLYEDKVATYILELAKVTNKQVSRKVLEKTLEELEDEDKTDRES